MVFHVLAMEKVNMKFAKEKTVQSLLLGPMAIYVITSFSLFLSGTLPIKHE